MPITLSFVDVLRPWYLVMLVLLLLATNHDGANAMVMMDRPASRGGRNIGGRPSKNKSWYNKRKNQGIKVARRGKKPPQWEKEGDALYQEIIQDNPYRTVNQKFTFEQAEQLLREKLVRKSDDEEDVSVLADQDDLNSSMISEEEPAFLWGGLSVGPVWKRRLMRAGFDQPTPIQAAAFTPIIQSQDNLILASATGSGKSLAYLLPLLTTRQAVGEESMGRVWIVTPTTELALQLQRMVATLLGEDLNAVGCPTLHVLSPAPTIQDENEDDPQLLETLVDSSSYFLAGTPRSFQQLLNEMDEPIIVNKKQRQVARNLLENLQRLVFDEADRLFQTEAVARGQQEWRQRQQNDILSSQVTKSRRFSKPVALELLESLLSRYQFRRSHQYSAPWPSSSMKLICASATVGRTLRRQLMEAMQSTSMEKAATLVTERVRTKKDALARKASLLPSSLKHAYRLLPESREESAPGLVASFTETLQSQCNPAPVLIFPGRTGVAAVQAELQAIGWKHVLGLDDIGRIDGFDGEWSDWKDVPIYVVSEKLGRGLDILQLGYVLLLQVPSSAAGYAHLGGRTGRNGKAGIVVSFCRAREVPKLVVIAEKLGLEGCFQDLSATSL